MAQYYTTKGFSSSSFYDQNRQAIMSWRLVFNFLWSSIGYFTQVLLTVECVFLVYKCAKFMFGEATTSKQLLKRCAVGRCLGGYEALFDVFSSERDGTDRECHINTFAMHLLC